jgi:heat shock protein HtpX
MHTLMLAGTLFIVLLVSAWLLLSWWGIFIALLSLIVMLLIGPRLTPESVVRMYRGVEVGPQNGRTMLAIVTELARRAELPRPPKLYVIPSATLNAFSTGSRDNSAIALTEGLIRRLDIREIAGVLAHEIAHVRNDDLWVMGLADGMTRLTRTVSWVGVLLFLINLPTVFSGLPGMSWLAIALLYFAPAIAGIVQLALSRAREYDADLDAAVLTGDATALASALSKLEAYQGSVWEDIFYPMRRVPHPSVLRSHPTTEERVARLRDIHVGSPWPPLAVNEGPLISTLAGYGVNSLRPRYRWMSGVWY